MTDDHKELLSLGLTVGIVAFALFIIHRFIPSMVWASVIGIATYPLYTRWRCWFGRWQTLAASLFTALITLLLVLPLTWAVGLLVKESQIFVNYLQVINRDGGSAPDFFLHIPGVSNELIEYWNANIGQPGKVRDLLSNLHVSLAPASYYIKQIGLNLAHRGFQLGFTLLSLFFFFRDGDALFAQVNRIGEYCLGRRWFRYANRLPSALRGTVNGTIAVGMGVGVLMWLCYVLVDFPAPTLVACMTALAAMIPFVVPVVFAIVAFLLLASGSLWSGIVVIVWGTIVMFIADHFVKPVLIGGAIQLPFLAVLFGILGGVETLGLLGLFVGPIVMVLFVTLWQELQGEPSSNA